MPFGMVSVVGRGMGDGDCRKGSGSVGVNLGHPIVMSGDFAMWLFSNYFGQDLLVLQNIVAFPFMCFTDCDCLL